MNKHTLVFLLLAPTIALAGPYIEVGIGTNTNLTGCSICWDDAGGVGTLLGAGYKWRTTKHLTTTLHWTHLSQVDKGIPFNDAVESSVDHIGVKLTYEY